MGHRQLGVLPRTHKWREVIELLEGEGSIPDIARASFEAALNGLKQVPNDLGFTTALTEILRFAEAAKSKDFNAALRKAGFEASSDATVLDLVGSLRARINHAFRDLPARTDIAELATNSFGEALIRQAPSALPGLFSSPVATEQETLRRQLTGNYFKGLMHEFYSVFTRRYLSYYLSRELSSHVGAPKTLFANIDKHSEFNKAFDTYIRQTVRISDEFTPGWFCKTSWEKGLSHQSVKRYAHIAFKKIYSEFSRGNGNDK